MGVLGLWKLIDSSGKPVPLETLENKIVAVDISIWLHQVVKGYQDGKGGHVQHAHLIGLFNRLCKLLYFRIKPVFVFDGRACDLKLATIAKRAKLKSKIQTESKRIESLLLENLAKEQLIKQALGDAPESLPVPSKVHQIEEKDDIFKLPEIGVEKVTAKLEETEASPKKNYNVNINKIDLNSSYFKSLPPDIRHDILTDLKETRKQNSWAKLQELPADSQDFSSYQMEGLLKRRQVQVNLDSAAKEMGGKVWSLSELEALFTESGVIEETSKHAQRIANCENTRFVLVRDIAKAMSEAKEAEKLSNIEPGPSTSKQTNVDNLGDEYDLELQRAIEMSLEPDFDSTEQTEVQESKPIKLNEKQRKNLGKTMHGLVRGFMMDYAEMNDDDLADMLEATQVPVKLDESLEASNDLSDAQISEELPSASEATQESVKLDDSLGTKTDLNDLSDAQISEELPSASEDKKELIISIDIDSNSSYKKEDDIFADIFESKEPPQKIPSSPDIEIASISSSDDDTIDYEIPKDLEKSFEEVEEVSNIPELEIETKESLNVESKIEDKVIELSDSSQPEEINTSAKSENEKFWQTLSENEDVEICINNEEKNLSDLKNEIHSPQKLIKLNEQPSPSKEVEDLRKTKTNVELREIKEQLEQNQAIFEKEKNKLNRMGTSITQQMTNDCKELLKLFGIPYIVAPMEAEAQCAFLNRMNITNGTITDDSDIWLFGAQTVYKNFFVQKKMVMEYRMENIEEMFHLDRMKLIQLAMLVGSDYTVGLQGVGCVTALEILASFQSTPEETGSTDKYQSMLSSLRKFREWLQNGKKSKMPALKNKLKNVEVIEGFPSVNILRAYLEPMVDETIEPFTWGKIDVESLMEMTRKLGWTRSKTEEMLNPVIKRLNEKKQSTIRNYFQLQTKKTAFDTQKLSKRVVGAINKMSGEIEDVVDEKVTKKSRKRRVTAKKTKDESDNDEPPVKLATPIKEKPQSSKKEESSTSASPSKVDNEISMFKKLHTKLVIPQKERDKKEAEANKQKAVEILKKSKKSLKK